MNIWYKRAGGGLLVLAGLLLYVKHIHSLLDWPHLYPDLGKLGFGNVFFLGLTLVLAGFAWIAAAYLLLNAKERVLHLLIPAAAFAVLLLLSGVFATKAVGEIPCSNTGSLAAFREDFDSESFRVRGKSLYPGFPMGELTGYSRYEKGEALAESVVRSYDQDGFVNESSRLAALDVPGVQYVTDPRERPTTLYELQDGELLWQVLLEPKTKTVTYSRFNKVTQLPSFAPQPTQPQGATTPIN